MQQTTKVHKLRPAVRLLRKITCAFGPGIFIVSKAGKSGLCDLVLEQSIHKHRKLARAGHISTDRYMRRTVYMRRVRRCREQKFPVLGRTGSP